MGPLKRQVFGREEGNVKKIEIGGIIQFAKSFTLEASFTDGSLPVKMYITGVKYPIKVNPGPLDKINIKNGKGKVAANPNFNPSKDFKPYNFIEAQ